MTKTLTIQNRKITYAIRQSKRARRMRLAVYCDGSVVMTTPLNLPEGVAERFITEKISWLLNKLKFFDQFKKKMEPKKNRKDYLRYKNTAYHLILAKIKYFNEIYKFKFNKINIRNQKTRWGSCSNKNNLSFNYKIINLPEQIQNYVIVHELCHLKEFNHSKKFWNLVVETIPNYLEVRNTLRRRELSY